MNKFKSNILNLLCIFMLSLFAVTASAEIKGFQNSAFGQCGSVTGGAGGSVKIISDGSVSSLEAAMKAAGKAIIIITKNITFTNHLSVQVKDKTILAMPGVKLISAQQNSSTSGILYIKSGSSNLIMRNLTFEGPGAYDCDGWDNLCFDGVTNAWVDHCDFQDGCDGNFDNKGNTDNITISWCRFHYLKPAKAGGSGGSADHRFTNLIGSSSSAKPSDGRYTMTWAYCWWDEGCRERMPRVRNADLHMLNDVWSSSVANYYVGPENAAAVFDGCWFGSSKNVFKSYGGTNQVKYNGCYSKAGVSLSNSGTTKSISYSYSTLSYTDAYNAVTNTSTGAGATLKVNQSTGECTAGDGSTSGGSTGGGSTGGGSTTTTYTVTASAGTGGTATVDKSSVAAGGTAKFTATPNSGYAFVGWTNSSGSTVSTSNPYTATINANTSLKANFQSQTACAITSCTVNGSAATISGTNITATVPYTAPTSGIVANITLSDGATADTGTSFTKTLAATEGATNAQTIVVTAKDGSTKQTYTLTIKRAGNATVLDVRGSSVAAGGKFTNSNATTDQRFTSGTEVSDGTEVSGMSGNSGSVYRSSDALSITIGNLPSSVSSITFGATSSGSSERTVTGVSVNGAAVSGYSVDGTVADKTTVHRVTISGLNAAAGGSITITMSGNTHFYYFELTGATTTPVVKSSNADLSALKYNGVSVPGFSASTTSYSIELPAGTTTIPTLSYTLSDSKASAQVTQASTLVNGQGRVVVTAEDGTTKKTYTVTFSVAVQKYDVKFYSDGAQIDDTQSIVAGGTATKPADPSKTGYTFKGWATTNGGTTAVTSFVINSNMNYYAIWQKNADESGSGSATGSKVWDFSPYTTVLDLIGTSYTQQYDGLTLVGYQGQTDAKKDYVSAEAGFHGNGNSTAERRYIQYTPTTNGTLTVTFKSNSATDLDRSTAIGTAVGTAIATATCETGTVSASLTAGTTYYVYFASGGQSITKLEFSTSTTPTNPEATKYTVKFYSDGTVISTQSIESGKYASIPSSPSKTGYTFAGWATTNGGTTAVNMSATAITKDTNFYAIFTQNTTGGSTEAGAGSGSVKKDGYTFDIDGFAAYAGTQGNAWYHANGTTGGAGGKVVYANNFPELQAYLQSKDPYIVLVDHDITSGITAYVEDLNTGVLCTDQSGSTGVKTTYGERIYVTSNKTLIGINKNGQAPLFSHITFVMQCTHNVIIRNCRFTMKGVPVMRTGENKIVAWRNGAQVEVGDPDCISIQADATSAKKDSGSHIWIDHCEFFNGEAAHKDRYDGLIDCKNNVQWLTFSYNYFHDHDKSCLWGKGDSDIYDGCRTISAHHNIFKNIDGSRLPLQRGGNVHYLNNYQENCSDGWDIRTGAIGYADACYFKNSKAPILPDGGGTLGICTESGYGIVYDNCQRVISGHSNVSYVNAPSRYDAEFAASTYVTGSWIPKDTWSDYFIYNRQKVTDVPTFLDKYAGAGKIDIWKAYASSIPAENQTEFKNAVANGLYKTYDVDGKEVTGETSTEPATTYDVKFMNGSTQVGTTQTVTAGGKATAPASNPTRDGYTFKGWSINGTTVVTVSAITINAATTFLAVWEEIQNPVDKPENTEKPTTGEGTISYDLTIGTSANHLSSTDVASSESIVNLVGITAPAQDGEGKANLTVKINGGENNSSMVGFTVANGYKFTPSSVSVKVQPVGTSTTNTSETNTVKLVLSDGVNKIEKSFSNVEGTIATNVMDNTSNVVLTGAVTLNIYCYGDCPTYRLGSPILIQGELEEESSVVEEPIILIDGVDYNAMDDKVYPNGVVFEKSFTTANQWTSLYVPFAINVEDYLDEFDIAEIFSMSPVYDTDGDGEITSKDANYLIVTKKTSGKTLPNKPYLIRSKTAKTHQIEAVDGKLYAAANGSVTCYNTQDTYTIIGVYAPTTVSAENGRHYMSGGKIYHRTSGSATLKSNRWYMSVTERSDNYHETTSELNNNSQSSIDIYVLGEDDEVTGVDNITGTTNIRKNATYLINGIIVPEENITTGMYIKNGKTIIK